MQKKAWVGQNETRTEDCDGCHITFITPAKAWAVDAEESNAKWNEHCQRIPLNCFNIMFFYCGHISYKSAEWQLWDHEFLHKWQ